MEKVFLKSFRLWAGKIMFLLFFLVLGSCQPEKQVNVVYEASQAVSSFKLSYLDEAGSLQSVTVNPESQEDVWRYSMVVEEGDMVYVSGKYNDPNSSLRLAVKINGKIYKEAFSKYDTVKYLIVSGVVPYSD